MVRIVHTDSWVMDIVTKLADLAGVTKIAEHGQNKDHARPVVTRVTPCTVASADASSTRNHILQQFKRTRPPTVTGLGIDGLPQLSEPAVEANFVFAFVKRSEWQEDINANDFGCGQDGGSCPPGQEDRHPRDCQGPTSTILDYDSPNVKNPALDPIAQLKLVETLRRHEEIMIASGNVLPPPAYGVVCDIDVRSHAPIKQRARRIPLKYLRRLYELLKGLLEAGFIAFSSSPWVSPIAIVLKKNGQDIRLCIDYKMVNAITLIMEYAMPLVDDPLTEMESYLWFCSLDAASGFWAVMMTMRARWVTAFVCALGHFEWLRMPFGLMNAPMIYQRMIDNALWGFDQPKGGWKAFGRRMKDAEAKARALRKEFMAISRRSPTSARPGLQTKYEADHRALAENDPLMKLINCPAPDLFTVGEPDQSMLVPVFHRRSFVDDICFGGATFDECLETLDRLLA
ncbi:unnamed protein product [Phytophthora fragariaefolia]|uniref:Unnamed protein product n=1 Tax=Phytophthora fragariaefolia TaxID=1490495 RepID=A0A9W7CZF7_9STRA|nr:unnamed protein product [Phytophthora fragariaefolia]